MKRLAYLQQQNPHWREEADLTRYFVDAAHASIAPAVCSTPLLAWIAYGEASLWRMLCWMGLFWLVEWRLILVIRQCRQHDTHPLSVYQYYPAVRDCLLASSLLWGGCIWFMAPVQPDPAYQMLLLLWVAGIFALLCIMMAACRDIHVLFFAAFWAFPVFSLLNGGKRLELLALLGVSIYLLSQWRFVRGFQQTLFDTVQLKHANQNMMDKLVEMHVQATMQRVSLEENRQALQLAVAEGERLLECDALTGCFNQRALRRQLDKYAADSIASGSSWSLSILDLDHFKQVNDTFGHQAGDAVLEQLVQKVSQLLPDGLQMFRYGGEEFVVLAPAMQEAELASCLDGIRQQLAVSRWEALPASWQQTISAGVVACQPGEQVNHCLQQADLALYAAKHRGRNRICLASDLVDVPLKRFSHSS
ncbi:GGDEF domain-containing protein [Aquitalea sp.]|uniref:GGDEF domain-containing protein n=1 Tax=Aquitalea sp. TaxID=1872623 RepID=UPI00258B77AD|nr:GGDEF domain-containing protein [Aquitalea sp.]